ncbi:MAG TPA: class I SAM-dependent methyltransferase [Nannocystaceae bacterium]|nr:class I SAM-dependent methyltransferase [Nannocystaceae bacterium]
MVAEPEKISVTAKLSAYYRRFSDIAFAGEVAELIGAEEAYETLAREHGLDRTQLTSYAPMFEARYKSVSELIRKSGASQILELACGYSTRGLDLTRTGTLRYVETDLAGVISTKRELLDEIRRRHHIAPSPRHHVTVADALELQELRVATRHLESRDPLLVLCEGLMGYLTRAETERVAANVRALLGDHGGGCWIVPDFTFVADVQNLPPERVRLRAAVTGITQRQLDASAFADPDELASFFARIGFATRVASQIDETPSFASLATLGLPASLLDRLRPILRVWVMTPV